MSIDVTITGAKDSPAEYEDQAWLAADATAREAIIGLYEAGGTIANVAEAVQGGLEDAGAQA